MPAKLQQAAQPIMRPQAQVMKMAAVRAPVIYAPAHMQREAMHMQRQPVRREGAFGRGRGDIRGTYHREVFAPSRLANKSGDGGILGMIAAPFNALFGDDDAHKVMVPE
jgi:hypothetical protein